MKTILIVDDDPFTRNVFSQTLSRRGFQVVQAGSAEDALQELAERACDLIVVDGGLPDVDGVEFVGQLREAVPECEIVYLSSVFRSQPRVYEVLTDSLGVALVLHKPISPVEFCAQVSGLFGGSKEQGEQWFGSLEDGELIAEAESGRRAYRETLEERLRQLEEMLEGLRADEVDDAERVFRFVALLRGTASRYGFFAISRAAGRIETALSQIHENAARGARNTWNSVFDALDSAFVATRLEAHRAPTVESVETAERQTATVLVVDDDPEFLEQVEAFGREHVVRVLTARTPLEVVDRIRDPELDAVLVDVDLGDGFDTFEFVRKLRERSHANRLPLGFIAEHGSVPDRVMAAHIGASVFVDKPLDSTQFADIVHRMVTVRQRRRPAVIIVDRDPEFVRETWDILVNAGMDVHHIDDTGAVVERLDEVTPDGLIVNVTMPGIGGYDLCRMIRAMPRWHDLPILLVGEEYDPETRIAAFRSGADDYLAKPPIREELLARLQVRIERLRLLREQASVDMLTGLLTRRPFLQRFNARLSEVRRSERRLAIGLLDLDRFKAINDEYGHIAGDRVLSALGRLLAKRFRLEDLRCRWGGEEFLVALIDEDAATARRVLQRTLDEFSDVFFVGDEGQEFSVTFSAGVAVFPDDGDDFRTLLAIADERLYAAKTAGRNRIIAD